MKFALVTMVNFMLAKILAKIFGTKNERVLRNYSNVVLQINRLEAEWQLLSDDELRAKTAIFKNRLAAGESLKSILPEAFATVRETSKRLLGMRHFDMQLIGGMALHDGCIAEMKTGEGKTLAATLPLYLNALSGKAHLVTVNDYLARRDSEWNNPIYSFLGIKCGFLQNDIPDNERKKIYDCDIVYGTNSEFGFDYLRDNMKYDHSSMVQQALNFAIVDEVDSILIDEARTPLIISGASEKEIIFYKIANDIVKKLSKSSDDFEVDEKAHMVMLSPNGIDKIENILSIKNIYAPENVLLLHHINQALRAHYLFKRDVDYMVSARKEILIVDEFTGRALPGRRFSDGLHQAIEAKEGVKIERENQTLATITLQNYFRMYKKLAGMTGTALSDSVEFYKIYNLSVVVVPTQKPMIRKDEEDALYLTEKAKYKAVCEDIQSCYKKKQPVLVGTASIEASEHLSSLLKKKGIPHSVLNAKQHAKEALIVKEAGEAGKVTISTSMAGRGTDIKLGEGVAALGGLRVIGTERYENRRIDDQLRGRSGRQGDPGSSKFYISFEDSLMRIFGGDNVKNWMQKYGGMEEDEVIESSWASSMVKSNQEKQEQQHFEMRKHSLEYDDVMNQQRNLVYSYRKQIISDPEGVHNFIKNMIKDVVKIAFENNKARNENLIVNNLRQFGQKKDVSVEQTQQPVEFLSELTGLAEERLLDVNLGIELKDIVLQNLISAYEGYRKSFPEEEIHEAEKLIVLSIIDYSWKNHLQNLDHLKEGINLRSYGQKNPLYEYKKESYIEFTQMIENIKIEIISRCFRLKPSEISEESLEKMLEKKDEEVFSEDVVTNKKSN